MAELLRFDGKRAIVAASVDSIGGPVHVLWTERVIPLISQGGAIAFISSGAGMGCIR